MVDNIWTFGPFIISQIPPKALSFNKTECSMKINACQALFLYMSK